MKKKILVIESDLFLSGLICEFIEIGGFEVEDVDFFEDGWEQALSGRFDLVLLDLHWALVSGIFPDRQLSKLSDIPVIITAEPTEIDTCYYGAPKKGCGLLLKPFTFLDLMLKVKEALAPQKARLNSNQPASSAGFAGYIPQVYHRDAMSLMVMENEV